MEIHTYQINISRPPQTVWSVLTEKEHYQSWTKAFSEHSSFSGTWEQGSEMTFIDPDYGGTKVILDRVEFPKIISARHIAMISQQGEESTQGDMADKWVGTLETYKIESTDSGAKLVIEMHVHPDFISMFDDSWPGALENIKSLCESL